MYKTSVEVTTILHRCDSTVTLRGFIVFPFPVLMVHPLGRLKFTGAQHSVCFHYLHAAEYDSDVGAVVGDVAEAVVATVGDYFKLRKPPHSLWKLFKD